MEAYTIADIEQLTGIRAHTLRKWEKRYHTFLPHRTPGNTRYYDDDQLRRLLNVATLLQHKHRISKLAPMSDDALNALVLDLQAHPASEEPQQLYVNNLISAMTAFNEAAFDKIISALFIRLGVYDAMLTIIYPFLRKTGLLWSTNNTTPAQEHFASMIIRRKLQSAIDGIPFPEAARKKFLLFLPPDEWHELGLLFSDYIIRSAGGETCYLGPNLPYGSLSAAIDKCKPDYLLTFLRTGAQAAEDSKKLLDIMALHPGLVILACNNGRQQAPEAHAPIVFLGEPADLFPYLS